MSTPKMTLISKKLDSVPVYHILQPTGPQRVGTANIQKVVGFIPAVVMHYFKLPKCEPKNSE